MLGSKSPQGLLGNFEVKPLPGEVPAEADAIATTLRTHVGAEPIVYRGKQASESQFKKLKSPRVLVIASTGFFLPDQAFDNMPLTDEAKAFGLATRTVSPGLSGKDQPLVPNPLLRCGLALAGESAGQSRRADDGCSRA